MRDYGHKPHRVSPDVMKEESLQLPAQLDEHSITNHLKTISRTNPDKLPGTVRAIREAWAYHRASWVERGRLDYLNTVLQQLNVSNSILDQCLEMEAKWMAHQDLKSQREENRRQGIQSLKAEAEAEELRARIEAARAQQAEQRHKRGGFENPATPKHEPTAEERRRENLRSAEEKIARLQARMKQHLAELLCGRRFEELSPEEQDDFRADENNYQDRIRQAKEDRMKYE